MPSTSTASSTAAKKKASPAKSAKATKTAKTTKTAKKSPAKPKTTKVAKSSAAKATISPEQRHQMIEEAAYYIAESAGFNGNPQEFWATAEAQIHKQIGA